MSDIKKGIQYAFQTSNNMTLAMSGSGHTAMECAVFNIVSLEKAFSLPSMESGENELQKLLSGWVWN